MTSDQWAPLNDKLDDPTGLAAYPGQYIPETEQRRIMSVKVLSDLVNNAGEGNLTNSETRLEEWGVAALVVKRIVAGLIGGGLRPVVHGAAHPPADSPTIPERPESAPEGSDARDQRIAAVRLERWEKLADRAIDEWEASHGVFDSATARQRWLDEWWTLEQADTKIYELEYEGAVPMGDGVAVFAWSVDKNRPTMTIYNSDSYFPQLSSDDHEFPTDVRFAWVDTETKALHHLVYKLGPILPAETNGQSITLHPGDRLNSEGLIERQLPWDVETWVTNTVFLTDAVWQEGDHGTYEDLDPSKAEYRRGSASSGEDLKIGDYLPILHLPNTPSTVRHFGRSSIILAARLIEILQAHCFDMAESAGLSAIPAFLSKGVLVESLDLTPGAVTRIDLNAEIEALQLNGDLKSLTDFADWLIDLLAVVTEVGAPILGLSNSASGDSGIKFRLKIVPFEQMIETLRITRSVKYPLMTKMVQRLAYYGGTLNLEDDGPVMGVDIEFGAITPSDQDAVVDRVTKALAAKSISRATALQMLVSAGFPVGDAEQELERIQHEDYPAALVIADATGSEAAAAEHLNLSTVIPVATDAPVIG